METKMLRRTVGVKRMDRIRNDAIQQKFVSGKRPGERTKQRWSDALQIDMKATGLLKRRIGKDGVTNQENPRRSWTNAEGGEEEFDVRKVR
ncbi:unnamed protein product [Heligmosomoides polygyrus]|uniref:DUF834 domain-containing protein n=1 Tax=Heligmosomoides polygyrus TaxID=6339 RepID=A0A183FA45_HELPZ|nr:unnamed protein product [Heligmosomoides polygyrus]